VQIVFLPSDIRKLTVFHATGKRIRYLPIALDLL